MKATLDPRLPYAPLLGVPCGQLVLWSVALDNLFSAKAPEFKHVVTVNSEIFTYAHEIPTLGQVLAHTVNTIDGRVLQWICQLRYRHSAIAKLAGSDFVYQLAEHCVEHSERLFLLGATHESNCRALAALEARWPQLQVAGYSPPFRSWIEDQDWNEDILGSIRQFSPTHLVVCFGPIKQEMWIFQNSGRLCRLGVRCAYGLGGTLDFVAGVKKRAPKCIQAIGLEWFFRFLCEPRQRFRRTLKMFEMLYFAFRPVHPVAGQLDGVGKS